MDTPLPDLSLRQLEYLVAVDDHDTWAQAAASVGVSPSALSQGLAELERRVGVALFEPVGRRRVIRDAARPVVSHARQVLGLTGDLVRWADRVARGRTGAVRLGMIDASAVLHHPDVLRGFREAEAEVDLRLTVAPSSVLLDQLESGHLDLVVCVKPPRPIAGVEQRQLMSEKLSVYAPPGDTPGRATRWGPWVLFPADSHTRALITAALVERGAPVEVIAESHQPDVLREMVRMGLGWTVLPSIQAEHGDRALDGGIALATRDLIIATRQGSVTDPAVEDLAERLLQES